MFNWHLSKALGDYLLANYEVDLKYTHEGDHTALDPTGNLARELAGRSHVANSWKADLLVSLHHDNTGRPDVRGASLWVWTKQNSPQGGLVWLPATGNHTDPKTHPIAQRVVKPIREALGKLGVPWRWWDDTDGVACANFGILRNTECAALLIECFHGSNAEDVAAARKPEFIPTLAKAIGDAVAETLNLDMKLTAPPPNGVLVLVDGKVVECKAHLEDNRTVGLLAPVIAALGGGWVWNGEKRIMSIRTKVPSG